jgi:bifunctional UDP-N-acetylglucosamine pyrophosphorylase/glucosamine-1-phosphate N-acetyltransferase
MTSKSHPSGLAAIILGAGMGTRMQSNMPKVLHKVAGRPMVQHLIASVEKLQADRVVTVIGPDMDDVAVAVAPYETVEQTERLGTGHAVLQAKKAFMDALPYAGDVLILYGDTPLITEKTLRSMLAARATPRDPAVVVLGFTPPDAGAYGRLVVENGDLNRIVEFKDASPAEQAITLCNSGVMCVDGKVLFDLLAQIDNTNAKGEYYLTDLVALARKAGRSCAVVEGDYAEMLGVNSRAELAQAERILQDRLRADAMAGGATLVAPETVHFSYDTRIGKDVVIEPYVVFGPGVEIESDVHIKGFCHFENAVIRTGATVGPYARLRPGADIGESAHIGNFVEIKKATVGTAAKVNHLTYIGDAEIGARANIGAGTITCNYDGYNKDTTTIGADAFIGSNTSLVAPVCIGAGASIGAGSVITRHVEEDALALTRADQRNLAGMAKRLRARNAARKNKMQHKR